jgi:hypothetical protein
MARKRREGRPANWQSTVRELLTNVRNVCAWPIHKIIFGFTTLLNLLRLVYGLAIHYNKITVGLIALLVVVLLPAYFDNTVWPALPGTIMPPGDFQTKDAHFTINSNAIDDTITITGHEQEGNTFFIKIYESPLIPVSVKVLRNTTQEKGVAAGSGILFYEERQQVGHNFLLVDSFLLTRVTRGPLGVYTDISDNGQRYDVSQFLRQDWNTIGVRPRNKEFDVFVNEQYVTSVPSDLHGLVKMGQVAYNRGTYKFKAFTVYPVSSITASFSTFIKAAKQQFTWAKDIPVLGKWL